MAETGATSDELRRAFLLRLCVVHFSCGDANTALHSISCRVPLMDLFNQLPGNIDGPTCRGVVRTCLGRD